MSSIIMGVKKTFINVYKRPKILNVSIHRVDALKALKSHLSAYHSIKWFLMRSVKIVTSLLLAPR